MKKSPLKAELIKQFCTQSDLRTYDPYDVWKTRIGFHVKNTYNRSRTTGLAPAIFLTLFDTYLNNRKRAFYEQQEYPIVRALAALALLEISNQQEDDSLLVAIRQHLQWLAANSCTGYSGPCWGLGFRYAVDKALVYDVNTPLTTMTPYALEAFVNYTRQTGDSHWRPTILGIYDFLERDVPILEETDEYLVTAYSSLADRKVVNAVSYVMYSYSLLYEYIDVAQRDIVERKIRKLYNYLRLTQSPDGSWPYTTEQPSFVDCFHSCFIIKNVIKTARVIELDGWRNLTQAGYAFLKAELMVPETGLFRRFARTNKPGIVRFDLYDNAEMLYLAQLMGDSDLVHSLDQEIERTFVRADRIFSQIDIFGIKHGLGMLRWAIMPYMHALATVLSDTVE